MNFEFKSPIARIQLFNLPAPIDDWDNGGGGGSGGGGSSSPISGKTSVDTSLITPTGGLFEGVLGLMIPVWDIQNQTMKMGTFDFEDFNTEIVARYKYREEVAFEGRQTTVSRIRIRYRDLGKVKVKFSVLTDEFRVPTNNNTKLLTFGGTKDGKLHFTYFDKVITGTNPQVYFERAAEAGPLSITRVTMITTQEATEQV